MVLNSSAEQLQCCLSPQLSSRMWAMWEGGLPISALTPRQGSFAFCKRKPRLQTRWLKQVIMLAPPWCGDVNRRKSMHKVTEIMSSCFVLAKFNQDGSAYIWAIFCSHWEWSELKSINIYVSNWITAWEPSQQGRLGVTGKPMNRDCEGTGMDPKLLYSLWDPTSISRSLGKLFWD